MTPDKANQIIEELKEANVEVLNPDEILEATSIKSCSPLLKYNGFIKRVLLRHIISQIRNGKTYKKLKWFDVLSYSTKSRINTYKCLCCDSIFDTETDKLKEGRVSCPCCGANESSDINPMEILKDFRRIPFSDNHYIDRKGTIISTIGKFKYMKPQVKKTGHLRIIINSKQYFIHHLVLEAWGFPQPTTDHVVRHLNDIPDDNRLENLEWGLQKRNMADKKVNQKKLEEAIKEASSKLSIEHLSILTSYSIETLKLIIET